MFRISLSFPVIVLLAGQAAFAQAQCERPEAVAIPDGANATLDEMLEAQTGVREFLETMESYLDCLNAVIESADEETPPETVNAVIEQYNAAVGEMEAAAARFNEERGAYQQANPAE